MLFLINTFLGFLIAQLYDILTRNKDAEGTPNKFDLMFFLKDTYQKIILSLFLSLFISSLVYLNVGDFAKLMGQEWEGINNIVYAVIGFAPEIVLQLIRKRFGVLQSKRE